jgi:molecular chaperone HtpG
LFSALAGKLGDKVEKVVAAANPTDAPARITTEGPVSLEMERVLAQGPEGMEAPHSRRILELNAGHPVFDKLVAAQEAGDDDKLALYASLLYDQALLVEGLAVDDPVAFAQNVCSLM